MYTVLLTLLSEKANLIIDRLTLQLPRKTKAKEYSFIPTNANSPILISRKEGRPILSIVISSITSDNNSRGKEEAPLSNNKSLQFRKIF